ncbi:unnamed protein product [Cyprideis torosa]|uniref:Uncharacterized protein n=1 Tax=Cyprideis torosa TaxID=163714 RepID=A0A7R8ZMD4_9CRUS|nr:unnamed protein product [Cyprideis torosa]CAG0895311.1 unnamed protein product [Cyprideis torosa]
MSRLKTYELTIFVLASLAIAAQSASVRKVEREPSAEEKVLIFPDQLSPEQPSEQPVEQPAEPLTERKQTEESVPVEPAAAVEDIQGQEEVPEGPTEEQVEGFVKDLQDSGYKYDEEADKWVDADGNEASEDDLNTAGYRHFGRGFGGFGFGGFGGFRRYGGFGRGFGGFGRGFGYYG